jgi:hypothetical protein
METVPAQNVTLQGQVMLYTKPELLSRELHGNLGVNPSPGRFTFAAKTHICPLTVPEFGPAAVCYPIIFVGAEHQPVTVFGLEDGTNLFADPEAGFEPDVYIPAYIRRYPFVLAQAEQPAAGEEERMLVGVDRGYSHIVEGGQFPFFENGEPTQYTQRCIQFCNDFEAQHRMTISFVQLLRDLDLFENRNATYQPQGPDGAPQGDPVTVAQFFAVSEQKLNALPQEKLKELRDNGALAQIYAHLTSLFAWERLIMRALIRQQKIMDAQAAGAANAK